MYLDIQYVRLTVGLFGYSCRVCDMTVYVVLIVITGCMASGSVWPGV